MVCLASLNPVIWCALLLSRCLVVLCKSLKSILYYNYIVICKLYVIQIPVKYFFWCPRSSLLRMPFKTRKKHGRIAFLFSPSPLPHPEHGQFGLISYAPLSSKLLPFLDLCSSEQCISQVSSAVSQLTKSPVFKHPMLLSLMMSHLSFSKAMVLYPRTPSPSHFEPRRRLAHLLFPQIASPDRRFRAEILKESSLTRRWHLSCHSAGACLCHHFTDLQASRHSISDVSPRVE